MRHRRCYATAGGFEAVLSYMSCMNFVDFPDAPLCVTNGPNRNFKE